MAIFNSYVSHYQRVSLDILRWFVPWFLSKFRHIWGPGCGHRGVCPEDQFPRRLVTVMAAVSVSLPWLSLVYLQLLWQLLGILWGYRISRKLGILWGYRISRKLASYIKLGLMYLGKFDGLWYICTVYIYNYTELVRLVHRWTTYLRGMTL